MKTSHHDRDTQAIRHLPPIPFLLYGERIWTTVLGTRRHLHVTTEEFFLISSVHRTLSLKDIEKRSTCATSGTDTSREHGIRVTLAATDGNPQGTWTPPSCAWMSRQERYATSASSYVSIGGQEQICEASKSSSMQNHTKKTLGYSELRERSEKNSREGTIEA